MIAQHWTHFDEIDDAEDDRRDTRDVIRTGGRAILWISAALWALILFGAVQCAQAEPLALIHTPSSTCIAGALRSVCTLSTLGKPGPDSLVAPCATPSDCWAAPPPKVQKFSTVAGSTVIDACNNPALVGSAPSWESCGEFWQAMPASTFAPDPSTFAASVLSGVSPVSTVLTWDVTGVTGCTASGSWTGAKAVKGTQAITGLVASAKYTLTCTSPVTVGTAILSWDPPTQNTDGSALTDLAGFRVVYGVSQTALTNVVQVPGKDVKTYTVTGLTPGATHYFSVRAYTQAAESANSAIASKSIGGSPGKTWTKSVDVAVTAPPTIPIPPTGLTVIEKTAYRFDQTKPDTPRLFAVGTVPLGTACDGKHPVLGLYRVPKSAVTLVPGASVNIALAKCG